MELKKIIKLAIPVIIGQVGQMTMGLVDTLVVGQVGAAELGATGAGSGVFWAICASGIGVLLAMDSLISKNVGKKDHVNGAEIFFQCLWVALFLGGVGTGLTFLFCALLPYVGSSPDVLVHIQIYLDSIAWSMPPILIYVVLQRYWQSYEVVVPFTWMIIFANLINLIADYGLVLGKWGLPQMGVAGVGISTLINRFILLGIAIYFTLKKIDKVPDIKKAMGSLSHKWRLDKEILKNIFSLGLPSGGQIALEISAFAGVAVLATLLGAIPSAAHQIAISIASLTFMFPLGLSSAAAVRVGTLIGEGKPQEAARSGWISIALGTGFMVFATLILFLFGRFFFGLFTQDAAVIEQGMSILFLAVCFQIFDGIQVTGTGTLRGSGETKLPALSNLIGHYPIGLTLGIYLCFYQDWGVLGLWTGLTAGLIATAAMILGAWTYRSRRL